MFFHHSNCAIIHIDADAFFASCEQALNPALKGKPVVTGAERNIVSAASYEAKKLGIKRGVPLWEVKKICPQAVILPSHYETYSLFSKRLFDLIKRVTSQVEEYSIDEAFVDISGLRAPLHQSYQQIALDLKKSIESELDITVSVGLSYSKVLAKIASKLRKPSGFMVISHNNIENILQKTELSKIWGIGYQTSCYLHKYGIYNALELIKQKKEWVEKTLAKPYREIWQELQGYSIYKVIPGEKKDYKNISKTKTFTPSSSDSAYVFSELSKNIENAFIKCRRHNLLARKIIIYLKTSDFHYQAQAATFNRATGFPSEVIALSNKMFEKIFSQNFSYRATGVVLLELQSADSVQMNLFEPKLVIEKWEKIYESLDSLDMKYGKHTVFLGSSFNAYNNPDVRQKSRQKSISGRAYYVSKRHFLPLPFLGEAA